jgi:hypothetical protein
MKAFCIFQARIAGLERSKNAAYKISIPENMMEMFSFSVLSNLAGRPSMFSLQKEQNG